MDKDEKRGINAGEEPVKLPGQKVFPCKRLKGEHDFVEQNKDSKHPYLKNEWHKPWLNADHLSRWRLWICSGCRKRKTSFENMPIPK